MRTEEYWKKYVDLWNAESDRFWMRSNIYLVVNGGLLILITGLSKIPLFSLIVCLFGIGFACVWHQTNVISKHYVSRWKVLIEECEKEMGGLHGFTKKLADLKRDDPSIKNIKASTTHMLHVIKMLIAIWVIFALLFLIQININGLL